MDGFVEENPVDTIFSCKDPPSFPFFDEADTFFKKKFASLSCLLQITVLPTQNWEVSLIKMDEDIIDILESPDATKTFILFKEILCNVCGKLFNSETKFKKDVNNEHPIYSNLKHQHQALQPMIGMNVS